MLHRACRQYHRAREIKCQVGREVKHKTEVTQNPKAKNIDRTNSGVGDDLTPLL